MRRNQDLALRLHCVSWLFLPCLLHLLPFLVSNCLNLPFRTQGRSWRTKKLISYKQETGNTTEKGFGIREYHMRGPSRGFIKKNKCVIICKRFKAMLDTSQVHCVWLNKGHDHTQKTLGLSAAQQRIKNS